eukprot:TRINITY_DN2196_c0_g1_i4.p1 TRINITY_DN2196_c0_g1~~TRINITY_DN2196_c0_g1_i4.p1  ORF type:complete len:605 (+),score=138.59 TRINITY_DN2196_c0_g1_i4:236-1816(+)
MVVALTAAAAAAVITLAVWPRLATNTLCLHGTPLPEVGGPGSLPLVGRLVQVLAAIRGQRFAFLMADWAAAAGAPNFQVWLGAAARSVVLTHPTDVRYVLGRSNPPRDGHVFGAVGLSVGVDSYFLNTGTVHAKTRALLMEPLNAERSMKTVVAVIEAELSANPRGRAVADAMACGTLGGLPAAAATGARVDVKALATGLTLETIHAVVVSAPAPAQPYAAVVGDSWAALRGVRLVPAPRLLTPYRVASIKSRMDYLVASVDHHETERRSAVAAGRWVADPPTDVLDVLMAERDGGGAGGIYEGGHPTRMARDLITLIMAGYGTTADAICWGIFAVCAHPNVEAALVAELIAANPSGDLWRHDRLAALPYLDAVWKETMRRYPAAASGTARRLAAPVKLPSDGAVLPAGTVVFFPQLPLQHNGSTYERPLEFCPSRWTGGMRCAARGGDTKASERAAAEAWLPFATGPLSCPAQRLAAMEFKATLAVLFGRYHLSLAVPAASVTAVDEMTMQPSEVPVVLTPRVRQ